MRDSVPPFPSMKARELLGILARQPLGYRPARRTGSHVSLVSPSGYPPLTFAFHDRDTIPPGLVRKILIKDVGLTEEEAFRLL
jgi:predicted RNA binding protein YcfA (HicA-like mRNA interferase family)